MNGSRSYALRQGESTSIDALNRTIQGLEARIEGLMAPQRDLPHQSDPGQAHDSVADILMRQRALSNSRSNRDNGTMRDTSPPKESIRARMATTSSAMQNAHAIKSTETAMQDIAQALVGLRHELKKDITDGISREVQNLRTEIRGIKPTAHDQSLAVDMRDDLAKLADSINRLGHQASPSDAAGLRAEFNELRRAVDGLAREDSLTHLEHRWTGVEQKLNNFDPRALQDDLLSLAYQLEDVKSHVGTMSVAPAVQSLETRLIALANDIESMGDRLQPNDRALEQQFAGLDLRLDEISRAIAAASRNQSPSLDPQLLKSFEARINQIADAVELAQKPQIDLTIAPRIEALAERVDELLETAAASKLDERLDQLSRVMEDALKSDRPPELSGHLSDISRKIDALDAGAVNNELAKQLEILARRIEDFTTKPAEPNPVNTASMVRLENRLDDIASRLDNDQLSDLSRKIDALDRTSVNSELARQLSLLAQRMEDLASRPSEPAFVNTASMVRLEDRLDDIASRLDGDHLSDISRKIDALDRNSGNVDLAKQLNLLASRMEELAVRPAEPAFAGTAPIMRLEDKLDDIASRLDGDHLSDISRKIDALDRNSGNVDLAKQLNLLASRMEELAARPAEPAFAGNASIVRLEDRLDDIAARLDNTSSTLNDASSFQNLETQLANLTELLNQSTQVSAAGSPQLENRMAALEDYIATSDEFIMQAARQAAEAVAEAFNRHSDSQNGGSGLDDSTVRALSEDLRHLEEITRSSEQRTQKTFSALHDTLVQIANRLDRMDEAAQARPKDEQFANTMKGRLAEPVAAASQPMNDSNSAFMDNSGPIMARQAPAADRPSERSVDPMALVESARQDFTRMQAESEMQYERQARSMQDQIVQPAAPRVAVRPAPPTDAVLSYEPSADDSMLLEPGSGVPDVKKILAKVRASQSSGPSESAPGKLSESEKADFISAARRAAREAAAEIENDVDNVPSRISKRSGESKLSSILSKNRRALLVTAGVIVLGVLTYPMLSTMISGTPSPAPAEITEVAPAPADPATNAAVAQTEPTDAGDGMTAATVPDADTAAPAPMPNATDGAETAMTDDATVKADMTASDGTMMMEPVTKPAEAEAMAATETPVVTQPAVAGIDVPDAVGPVELVTAARSGDALALYEIGSRFTDGRGVKADLGEAVKWYQLAADKGQAVAQYRLANFYEKGNGVTQNIGKAKELYETSAGLGNASAMHNLAVLAATGRDSKPDMVTAAKWFKQAADMGIKDSQFNLAILYAQGKGVETDLTESYKWFAVAAREGDADAGQKRDEVAKVLKPDQLKAAKAKVDGWKAVPASAEANNPVVPDAWIEKSSSTSSIDMKKAITNIQAILNNNGFNVGKPDGMMGAKTVAAIKAFQTSVGQKPTGEITDALVKELLARNKKS